MVYELSNYIFQLLHSLPIVCLSTYDGFRKQYFCVLTCVMVYDVNLEYTSKKVRYAF